LFLAASDRQSNFSTFLHEQVFQSPFRKTRGRLTIDRANQIVSLQVGLEPWRVCYDPKETLTQVFGKNLAAPSNNDSAVMIRVFIVGSVQVCS